MKKRVSKMQRPKLTPELIDAWRTVRRLDPLWDAHQRRNASKCPNAPYGAFIEASMSKRAANKRRYRARRRAGQACWTVAGDDVAVPMMLVDLGLLDIGAVDDKAAIGAAISKLLAVGIGPVTRILIGVSDG